MFENLTPAKMEKLLQALLPWYEENSRALPWRRTNDPYPIWISEIMAQQTRIGALLPYYNRFMASYPTVLALAQAPIQDVLKHWEGLGYYARAHNLHKTAQIIAYEKGGQFPSEEKDLRSLPGIGEYTAGAIMSMAFHLPVPAVDGNALRVFTRLEADASDIAMTETKKRLIQCLTPLMPLTQSGLLNQAIMDLGAMVCLPKNPKCSICPLSHLCMASIFALTEQIPYKTAKKPPQTKELTVLVIMNQQGQLLVRQRTERLLQGLWEFYLLDTHLSTAQLTSYLQKHHLFPIAIDDLGMATHIFTHLKWEMKGYFCQVDCDIAPEGYHFVTAAQYHQLTFPSALRHYNEQLNILWKDNI